MNLSESARALCPYYKRFRDREIQCESCVARARLVFVFRSRGEATGHKRQLCDTYGWTMCPYAKLMDEGWENEEELGVRK